MCIFRPAFPVLAIAAALLIEKRQLAGQDVVAPAQLAEVTSAGE
jgi:hypothetical protein